MDTIEEGNFDNDEEILKYLETTLDKNEAYPIGLYMGDDSGVYLDGSGWVPDGDWVLTVREWFVEGKENKEFAFGAPYYDSMTGDVCVSASVRVDYSQATRVLATDVYLNYVASLMKEISEQSDVKAFLVTSSDKSIIAHPDTKMLTVTLDSSGNDSLYNNIGSAIDENKSGVLDLDGDSGKYYVTLNKVENTDWYLVTYITEKNTVDEAIDHMNVSVSVVEKNVEMVAETKETFVKLYGKVEETGNRVEEIIELIGEVDSVAEQMETIMESQRAAAGQIVESAQGMNSSTENVSADSNTVADSAEAFKKESLELMDRMSKFRV